MFQSTLFLFLSWKLGDPNGYCIIFDFFRVKDFKNANPIHSLPFRCSTILYIFIILECIISSYTELRGNGLDTGDPYS